MPRQRQRIVFCDCYDCVDRPQQPSLSPEQLDAATAVARQEPPPKALIIYATGMVSSSDGLTNLEVCTLPHCDLVVREGNLGMLAVRKQPQHSSASQGASLPRAVSELAQLLGVHQDAVRQAKEPQASGVGEDSTQQDLPSLAARFKGLQGAIASTSPTACRLAQRTGMALCGRLCVGPAAATAAGAEAGKGAADRSAGAAGAGGLGLPDAKVYAAAAAEELGAAEGGSGRDLLLLHFDLGDLRGGAAAGAAAPEAAAQGRGGGDAGLAEDGQAAGLAAPAAAAPQISAEDALWDAGWEALEWLDALLKGLLSIPAIRERTLLVFALSPAGQPLPSQQSTTTPTTAGSLLQPGGAAIDPAAAVVTPLSAAQVGRAGVAAAATAAAAAACGPLAVLDTEELPLVRRPVQSYQMLGMEAVDVDPAAPVLVVRRLPGVVRRDRAQKMTWREAATAGGQGVILLDRLLPEVAYKLARAPKYGA